MTRRGWLQEGKRRTIGEKLWRTMGGKSGEFFLFASCLPMLLGVPRRHRERYLHRVDDDVKKKFRSIKNFEKIDKNEENYKKEPELLYILYINVAHNFHELRSSLTITLRNEHKFVCKRIRMNNRILF